MYCIGFLKEITQYWYDSIILINWYDSNRKTIRKARTTKSHNLSRILVTIWTHISKSKRRYLNTKLLHQYESETEKLHRKKSTSNEACKTNNPYKNPYFFVFFWVNIAIQMLFSYLTSSIANGFSNRNCYIHRFNTWTYIP